MTSSPILKSNRKASKGLSVITNYGCHWNCKPCITRDTGNHIPLTTDLHSSETLVHQLLEKDKHSNKKDRYTSLSISGGGDPLYGLNLMRPEEGYSERYYGFRRLGYIAHTYNVPFSLHTSIVNWQVGAMLCLFDKVTVHISSIHEAMQLNSTIAMGRWGNHKPIFRVVMVVTPGTTNSDIMNLSNFVRCCCNEISSLSFRQMVYPDGTKDYTCFDYLRKGHKQCFWYYIEQNDYNDYIVDGKVYNRFSDVLKIGCEPETEDIDEKYSI